LKFEPLCHSLSELISWRSTVLLIPQKTRFTPEFPPLFGSPGHRHSSEVTRIGRDEQGFYHRRCIQCIFPRQVLHHLSLTFTSDAVIDVTGLTWLMTPNCAANELCRVCPFRSNAEACSHQTEYSIRVFAMSGNAEKERSMWTCSIERDSKVSQCPVHIL